MIYRVRFRGTVDVDATDEDDAVDFARALVNGSKIVDYSEFEAEQIEEEFEHEEDR